MKAFKTRSQVHLCIYERLNTKKAKKTPPKSINENYQGFDTKGNYIKSLLILPKVFVGKTEDHSYLSDRVVAAFVTDVNPFSMQIPNLTNNFVNFLSLLYVI